MKESYLLLQSIDPISNRHRIYRIHVLEAKIANNTTFIVSCSWGRFQKFSHRKQFVFEDKKLLNQFLQSLLVLRKRHRYAVVEQSGSFPEIKAVSSFEQKQLLPLHSTLF